MKGLSLLLKNVYKISTTIYYSLIGHNEEFKKDGTRMERFKKLFEKLCNFRVESLSHGEVFDLYCKTTINSHTVASMNGDEVRFFVVFMSIIMGLCLGWSFVRFGCFSL